MGCERCCGSPLRRLFAISILLAICASFLAISSSYGCYFLRIEGFMIGNSPYFVQANRMSGIGLWSYEDITRDTSICVMYNQDQINNFLDVAWNAARFSGMAGSASLGLAMLLVIFAPFFDFNMRALQVVGSLVVISSTIQLATFVIYASKAAKGIMNGTFYAGSALSAVGAVLGLSCAMTVFLIASTKSKRHILHQSSSDSIDVEVYKGAPPEISKELPPSAMGESDDTTVAEKDDESGSERSRMRHGRSHESDYILDDEEEEEEVDDDNSSIVSRETHGITVVSSQDGGVKIKNITVHGDGSRTVNETVIPCYLDLCGP